MFQDFDQGEWILGRGHSLQALTLLCPPPDSDGRQASI